MREPKQNRWRLSEPASFRFWVKRSMKPIAYDKALKKKHVLAVAYFFCSLFTLNTVIYQQYKLRSSSAKVTPENEILQEYFATTPSYEKGESRKAYIYNYENLEFKSAEHIDTEEMEKMRHQ